MTKQNKSAQMDEWVLLRLREQPGITAKGLALLYKGGDIVLGRHTVISRAIARLRRAGLVEDVGVRCSHCGAAQTRGHRNVELYLTDDGYEAADRLRHKEAA